MTREGLNEDVAPVMRSKERRELEEGWVLLPSSGKTNICESLEAKEGPGMLEELKK